MSHRNMNTDFPLIQVKGSAAADLLAELEAEHYEGPVTRTVTDQLWLYGWATLHARLNDGGIARLGARPGAREVTERDLDRLAIQSTRDDLVIDTLVRAVPNFVTVLKEGRYNPEAGTTIATFFAGFAFGGFRVTVHPTWANETIRREYELGQLLTSDEWYSTADPVFPDDPSAAVHQAVVYVIKKIATMAERPVVLGLLRGQTHREIAAALGITPKAVEHRLASVRKRAWTHRPLTRRDHHDWLVELPSLGDRLFERPDGLSDRPLEPDGRSENLWDLIWGDGDTETPPPDRPADHTDGGAEPISAAATTRRRPSSS